MQPYGWFEEKGYRFESYSPTTDSDPVAFQMRILIGKEIKHTLFIPMRYTPVFGVDVGDIQALESVADRALNILPQPENFNEATILALNKLEAEVGGRGVRKRANLPRVSLKPGQFEYTGNLFAARFAEIFCSREAVDQWMRTKDPKLDERTPDEALRLGMINEVLQRIDEIARERFDNGAAT